MKMKPTFSNLKSKMVVVHDDGTTRFIRRTTDDAVIWTNMWDAYTPGREQQTPQNEWNRWASSARVVEEPPNDPE